MSTYIIYSMGEPTYRVEADFYDIDKGFATFYDENDNLIVSINTDDIDFILDKDQNSKFAVLEPVDEENCEICDNTDCESNPNYKEPKKLDTPTKDKKKSDDNFDELFKRVLGLNGKK